MTILPPTIASLDQMLQTWKLAWRTVRLTDNKAVSLLVDSALSKRQGMSIKFASKSTFFFGRSWNCILNPIHHSASRIIIFMLSAYSNSQKVLWVFSFWALAFDSVISYSCRKSTQRRKRISISGGYSRLNIHFPDALSQSGYSSNMNSLPWWSNQSSLQLQSLVPSQSLF